MGPIQNSLFNLPCVSQAVSLSCVSQAVSFSCVAQVVFTDNDFYILNSLVLSDRNEILYSSCHVSLKMSPSHVSLIGFSSLIVVSINCFNSQTHWSWKATKVLFRHHGKESHLGALTCLSNCSLRICLSSFITLSCFSQNCSLHSHFIDLAFRRIFVLLVC